MSPTKAPIKSAPYVSSKLRSICDDGKESELLGSTDSWEFSMEICVLEIRVVRGALGSERRNIVWQFACF